MKKKSNLGHSLVRWYKKNHRKLPWRKRRDPYGIWVSEIMLQQTRVETVVQYYQRFMRRLPTVQKLAKAPESTVLKLWEGLGYYSRARNLHKAAKSICRDCQGRLPKGENELRRLPGIGSYTAGAIMSIAFNEPSPAVDGNVLRVMARLHAIRCDIGEAGTRERISRVVEGLIPAGHASEFNQGLMDLGATVCLPESPRCDVCPVRGNCEAHTRHWQERLPRKAQRPTQREQTRYVAVVERKGRVLMRKRPAKGLLAGLWEFPSVAAKTKRESIAKLSGKYGLPIQAARTRMRARHVFSHVRWDMKVYDCELALESGWERAGLRWVEKKDLRKITVPTAFARIRESVFG